MSGYKVKNSPSEYHNHKNFNAYTMLVTDIIKSALMLVLVIFLFSLLFTFLFKVGIIALLVLGIMYLYRKVTEKSNSPHA